MKFGNIRAVKSGKNFINFIKPITKFSQVLTNSVWKPLPTKYDCAVVTGLIDHYLGKKKNKFDIFSNELFEAVMQNYNVVHIDVEHLYGNWSGDLAKEFGIIFLSKECEKMIKISYLTKLMRNLKNVCLQWNFHMEPYSISKKYLGCLYSELLKLSSNASLKEIKILNARCDGEEWKQFEKQLEKIKFGAKIEKRNEGYNNKEIPCLIIKKLY